MVDRHVLQAWTPGGEVKQSIWGRQDDVPVPKNISSMASDAAAEAISLGLSRMCLRTQEFSVTLPFKSQIAGQVYNSSAKSRFQRFTPPEQVGMDTRAEHEGGD